MCLISLWKCIHSDNVYYGWRVHKPYVRGDHHASWPALLQTGDWAVYADSIHRGVILSADIQGTCVQNLMVAAFIMLRFHLEFGRRSPSR